MSLSDRYTVPSKPGFSSILSKPDLRFNKGNYLLFGKENSMKTPRLGVSVKKRDYRLATQRNRLKRNNPKNRGLETLIIAKGMKRSCHHHENLGMNVLPR